MAQECEYENVLISHNNGTSLYMAPENTKRSIRNGVTPRADMFSLGVTLLEFALKIDVSFLLSISCCSN